MKDCFLVCPFMGHLYQICRPHQSKVVLESRLERWLTQLRCQLIYTPFGDVDQFSVQAVDCYERAFQGARQNGTRVRALVITNPHNPLGKSWTPCCRVSDETQDSRSVLLTRCPGSNYALLQQTRYTPNQRWNLLFLCVLYRRLESRLHFCTFNRFQRNQEESCACSIWILESLSRVQIWRHA
jgi:hypothetical protein